MPEDNDYDPYAHRDAPHPLTNIDALVNLLKSLIGTGILAMPLAYSQVGWCGATVFMLIMTLILVHCMHILLHAMYAICKRNQVPYMQLSDVLRVALKDGPPLLHWLSTPAAYLVDFVIAFNHFGVCCVYVVFVTANIKKIIDYYSVDIDQRIYIALLLIPVLIYMSIRYLKYLVPFAFAANLLIICGIFVVIYYIVQGLPPLSEREAWGRLAQYPLFIGTLLFSISSFGVMLVVEENMAKPADFFGPLGVLCQSQFLIVIAYTIVGFLGYWRYGEDAKGSITLVLPDDKILSQLVKGSYALAIFFSIAIHGYVPVDIICVHYLFVRFAEEKHLLVEYIVRACVSVAMILVALAVPFLGLLIALVGALFVPIMTIVFPGLVDVSVRYHISYGPFNIYLIRSIILFVFGILITCIATTVVIGDIIAEFKKEK